ncbi:hypothetical protein ACJ41O_012996 [Fusarium nematophilum]
MDHWNSAISSLLYSPLTGEDPLRLLQIHPGQRSDPISCHLIPTHLDDVDKTYIATSYTWGSPENPPQIECNGLSMKIQQNAFDMMTDLRLPDQPRTVWVDAICINQGDINERSEQVRIMHKIYSRCQRVMVWLGRPDEHSRAAMAFAATLDSARLLDQFIEWSRSDGSSYLENARQKDYFFRTELGTQEEKERAASIVRFINRPWFNRVWVQQEGSVCPDTQVICGSDTLDWHQVFALAWIITPPKTAIWPDYLPHTYRECKDNLWAIQSIQSYKIRAFRPRYGLDLRFPESWSLHQMLLNAPRFASTDPRDKIFAFLNVRLHVVNDWVPEANYKIPWEVLYTDISTRILKNGWLGSLSISGTARHPPDWILPSWVPDFRQWNSSVQGSSSELVYHGQWAAGGPFSNTEMQTSRSSTAARPGELPRTHRRNIQQSQMSQELRRFKASKKRILQTYISLRCFMMDEIVYVGGHMKPSPPEEAHLVAPKYREFIQQDLKYLDDSHPKAYMNGDLSAEAYKLTIISATDHNQDLVGPEYTLDAWEPWYRWLGQKNAWVDDTSEDVPSFNRAVQNSGAFLDFCFAVTKHGYFCLVPSLTQLGDHAVVAKGYATGLVIRSWTPPEATEPTNYYELLGDAYIHGMMNNEAGCIMLELDCKANPTEAQRAKTAEAARKNDGEAWRALDFGDYTPVIDTIGLRWISLV